MFFSVLMCVNKDNPFVEEAILSVLNQTFVDYEFIIVANGCDDGLYNKLLSFSKIWGNIKLHRTIIGQLSFNLNYAANLSCGNYLVRMDSDDVAKKNRLSVLYDQILSNDFPDVIGSNADLINQYGEKVGETKVETNSERIVSRLIYRNQLIHPSVAIKKESLIKLRGYLGGFNSEDYDLWLRASRLKMKIINVDSILIEYRISEFQVKGSLLAHAESLSYKIRELVLTKNFRFFISILYGVTKLLFLFRRLK